MGKDLIESSSTPCVVSVRTSTPVSCAYSMTKGPLTRNGSAISNSKRAKGELVLRDRLCPSSSVKRRLAARELGIVAESRDFRAASPRSPGTSRPWQVAIPDRIARAASTFSVSGANLYVPPRPRRHGSGFVLLRERRGRVDELLRLHLAARRDAVGEEVNGRRPPLERGLEAGEKVGEPREGDADRVDPAAEGLLHLLRREEVPAIEERDGLRVEEQDVNFSLDGRAATSFSISSSAPQNRSAIVIDPERSRQRSSGPSFPASSG